MPWVFSEISKSEPQHLPEHGYLFGKGAYTKTILLKHCNFISTRCILIQLNNYIIYQKLTLYYIETESILVLVINETFLPEFVRRKNVIARTDFCKYSSQIW